ncbi:MAG TPA: transposase [Chitinophagaceae bacterium]
MNEFKTFIGIDVSKKTFDAALLQFRDQLATIHQSFDQSIQGYKAFVQWLKSNDITIGGNVLFCLEHTGIYISGIVNFLVSANARIWVEMALKIKKRIGLQRGSDDKLAAINIALYAYRYKDEARLWKPIDSTLQQLKNLVAQRDRIVLSITQLTVPLNELENCGDKQQAGELRKLQSKALKGLKDSLIVIEQTIDACIEKDETIRHKINLASSVKGIGKQTAVALFVYTRGFSVFENAKQLACYCGVVPFNKLSGTSVRYKPGVSPFANKKLKKLLHLCALAALRFDAEIKAYYERKIAEGKNKMSIINAIRNKLILRIFAVIRDNRNYVDNYAY